MKWIWNTLVFCSFLLLCRGEVANYTILSEDFAGLSLNQLPQGWVKFPTSTNPTHTILFNAEGTLRDIIPPLHGSTNVFAVRTTYFFVFDSRGASGNVNITSPALEFPPKADLLQIKLNLFYNPWRQLCKLVLVHETQDVHRKILWSAPNYWQKISYWIDLKELPSENVHFRWVTDDDYAAYTQESACSIDDLQITAYDIDDLTPTCPELLSEPSLFDSNLVGTFSWNHSPEADLVGPALTYRIEAGLASDQLDYVATVPYWKRNQQIKISEGAEEYMVRVTPDVRGNHPECPVYTFRPAFKPVVTQFPYFEDFEVSPGGWTTFSDTPGGSSWEWGHLGPTKMNVTQVLPTSSWNVGTNVGTDLPILPPERSYLVSPKFQFQPVSNPVLFRANITFSLDNETNEPWSGYHPNIFQPPAGSSGRKAWVEYRLDSSSEWVTLGSDGKQSSFYSPHWNPYIEGTDQLLTQSHWEGNSALLPGGKSGNFWVEVNAILPFDLSKSFQLRFVFDSPTPFWTHKTFSVDFVNIIELPPEYHTCPEIKFPMMGSIIDPQVQPFSLMWHQMSPTPYQPRGYLLSVGTDALATNILHNQDIGYGSSFYLPEVPKLPRGTRVYWHVRPYAIYPDQLWESAGCGPYEFVVDTQQSAIPFFETFDDLENTKLTFYGENPSWQIIPHNEVPFRLPDQPTSGNVLSLGNPYHNLETSYVLTPELDFTGETAPPELSFRQSRGIQARDGLFVEMTVDQGATWKKIGSGNERSQNFWYDSDIWNPFMNVTFEGWSGGTPRWVTSYHSLDGAQGHRIQLRFVFWSDYHYTSPGVFIDNLSISPSISCAPSVSPPTGAFETENTLVLEWADLAELHQEIGFELHVGTELPFSDIVKGLQTQNNRLEIQIPPEKVLVYWYVAPFRLSDKQPVLNCWETANWFSTGRFSKNYTVDQSTPYIEDFETSTGGWSPQPPLWSMGTTTLYGDDIYPDASSKVAWSLRFDPNIYPFTDNTYVHETTLDSPRYDFSDHVWDPILSFSWWIDETQGSYGFGIQSSFDQGKTWQPVGKVTSDSFRDAAINWYNTYFLESPDGSPEGFSGRGQGWQRSSHFITGAAGKSDVRLRLAFRGRLSKYRQGMAFDNVEIKKGYKNTTFFDVFPLSLIISLSISCVIICCVSLLCWLNWKKGDTFRKEFMAIVNSSSDYQGQKKLDSLFEEMEFETELEDFDHEIQELE